MSFRVHYSHGVAYRDDVTILETADITIVSLYRRGAGARTGADSVGSRRAAGDGAGAGERLCVVGEEHLG